MDIASKYEVKAMPTFLLIKEGVVVGRLVGANPEEIKKRIETHLQSNTHLIDHFPVPGGELPSLEPGFHWSANSFPGSTSVVRFQELNEILDPGRSAKTDKTVILADAIRMITHLRNEATNLKDSSQDLLVKINELKVEKNELRDEKQKLKTDKERLEQHLKSTFCGPPTAFYPPAHPVMPVPCPGPTPVGGNKFMPYMGFQGVPMWQFAPPAAVDTSKDHVHRSPLA
ncbi:Myc-type, basic helix-loop-helix (bHLH) domain-containing protein [Artemisia annua]|uniref:Myc-type, basic helix-loop-helix (BHLH) domain-containing protein n=1 Tax=Artemisia annua TaxID=35608 RepID=A0A2U1P0H7_ARTAN|nr:Myc-type, basic helix-loop-helix (bHLH) domain-containing protein [Artemisia annua]